MSIEVIQPYKPQPIQFKSPDDFNIYYNKHADEFNETTYKLNVKYKIPGFKITKLKGELKLIKDYNHAKTISENDVKTNGASAASTNEVSARLADVEARLASIEQYLQQINA